MKFYQCVGANYINGYNVSGVGDIKTLEKWIIYLFGEKAISFFKNDKPIEIIEYIHKHTGKKLKIIRDGE